LKKKVLIISYSYPPSNAPAAQRPYAIAKYLDKSKYEVTVVTCSNQDSSMGLSDSFSPELPNVKLIKVRSIGLGGVRKSKSSSMSKDGSEKPKKYGIKRALFKILNWFMFPDKAVFWIPFVLLYTLRNRNSLQSDIVWSTSPLVTNHILARFLCFKKKKIKHIADFRDYHSLHNEVNAHGIKGWLHRKIEIFLLKHCNYATFISTGMKVEYEKHYPVYAKKFVAIYNGFDPEEFEGSKVILETKKLTFFYAGSFYGGFRSPKPLLLALESLLHLGEISKDDFCIEIAGNIEQNILDDLRTLAVFDAIRFLGLLQRKEVLKKYKESHVLWSIVSNSISHYTGVPIKFYEYLGSQRYILNYAKPLSETAVLVEQLDCGWSLPNTENIDEIHLNVLRDIFRRYLNKSLNDPLVLENISKFHRSTQTFELQQLF
tara:strand:+ start:4755 stop:6044 length:1290 start_codon:yes stop_codon:yes gene_type:complete